MGLKTTATISETQTAMEYTIIYCTHPSYHTLRVGAICRMKEISHSTLYPNGDTVMNARICPIGTDTISEQRKRGAPTIVFQP